MNKYIEKYREDTRIKIYRFILRILEIRVFRQIIIYLNFQQTRTLMDKNAQSNETNFHERNNRKTGNQRCTPKNYGLRQSASITHLATNISSFLRSTLR